MAKGKFIPIIPPFRGITHIELLSLVGSKKEKKDILGAKLPRLTFQTLRIYYGENLEMSKSNPANYKTDIHDIPYFFKDRLSKETMLEDVKRYEQLRLARGGDPNLTIIGYQGINIYGFAYRPARAYVTFLYHKSYPVTNIYLKVYGPAAEKPRFKQTIFKRMDPKKYESYLESNKAQKESYTLV